MTCQKMMVFFESDTSLSQRLSEYYGEQGVDACGHCSGCTWGKAELEVTVQRRASGSTNWPTSALLDQPITVSISRAIKVRLPSPSFFFLT